MRNDLTETITTFLKHKHPITAVFDVGANKGTWTATYEKLMPVAQFFLFEANPKHHRPGNINQKHKWFNVALSDPDTSEVEFYSIAEGRRRGTGDSYYKEDTVFYDGVSPTKMKTVTLDAFINENNLPNPQILKLDTQGSEIDILKGATETLKMVDIIYIETPILAYNKNAPSFDEYANYIMSCGFVPIGVDAVHINDNVLMQLDIVYIKKELRERYYNVKGIWKGLTK